MTKLRKWEHLEERKCLECGNFFVTKIWVCQSGILKGRWMIGSFYCSTDCSEKGRKKLKAIE